MRSKKKINGILLLYHHPFVANAATIMEHIDAFTQYSQFKVWKVNTVMGFPEGLKELSFEVIVLHYSLFGGRRYIPDRGFSNYLEECHESYKVAFFQDEHHYCQQRFAFLNHFQIDCVYTLVEPEYFGEVYQKYTDVPHLIYHIPGYVSEKVIEAGQQFGCVDSERRIDIGYRGRLLPAYMGKGSQEKGEISEQFGKRSRGSDLIIDLETKENERLYGEKWYKFLGDCKAVLGVEAGVSIFDVEDIVRMEFEKIIAENPKISFKEISERLLYQWEDNIYYRTISPRHFEAASFRNCQILFEGKYSGIMKPMVHYIPLKKDFSNFDEVITMFKDESLRRELTENAYRDLIASGQYSYKEFIRSFDDNLLKMNYDTAVTDVQIEEVNLILSKNINFRKFMGRIRAIKQYEFIGKDLLVYIYRRYISGEKE